MGDKIPAPTVKNELRQGNFTLVVMSYRPVSKEEIMTVAMQWLRTNKRKSFPASGTVTVITTIGLSE